MKRMSRVAGIILACALVFFALPVMAQSDTPQANAEQIRQQLFRAQGKLLLGDDAEAVTAMTAAYERYEQVLQPIFSEAVPDVAATLETHFATATEAVAQGDALTLAVTRGAIWTSILNASSQLAMQAVENNDGATAAQWLLLREFRSSTKFSRPGADATKAVQAFTAGNGTVEETITAIRNDLLDTYQAQLTTSLASAEDAHRFEFNLRQAEEVGLAAGYFDILGNTFAEQRGAEEFQKTQKIFAALSRVAVNGDVYSFQLNIESIQTALKGFRAAPLNEADQARRAGQLIRFVDLVSIEYKRGIVNGVVVRSIEIQEATTFLEASTAAFNDISLTLEQRDAAITAKVATLLNDMKLQIQSTADPVALENKGIEVQTLLKQVMPEEWQQVATDSDMDVIISLLDQIPAAVKQNQYDLAESARLEAYGFLELGIEQRLRGFAPEMASELEILFWQGGGVAHDADDIGVGDGMTPGLAYLIATRAPLEEIEHTLTMLKASFIKAKAVMEAGKSTPTVVVTNSAIIVFREGLEAVLILASLLASLRTAEELRYRRPIAVGALLAFVATAITWWAANELLQVMLPLGERLEAIVSLIAIGVLLLITNWFFHKVYWTGWMANFHTKKRTLIGGVAAVTISQTVGLIILGFTSIYREGFESVLFLQSLVLEAGVLVVLEGVLLGLLGVAVVGVLTFTLQRKLPYKKMLVVTGVMIGFVLLTMVGNTVHVMQVVGWLPITPIIGLNLPIWLGQWFGLFATWQGIGLQIAAAVFVIGSYYWAEHINKTRREHKTADHKEKAANPAELHA
ncbi:MAG: FTR1 family protein [Chloroflexi bacterium]|nr:FTR1 family protein [Chloroflexota bacterium]MCC6896311.1 FTR1 family protein [Anaerolineae bacterium]